MTEGNFDIEFTDFIKIFKKEKLIIVNWILIFLFIGIIFVIGTPKEYRSEVTLLVETGNTSSGMSGLLQQFGGIAGINLGTAGEDALTPDLYPEIIKSTPFLLEILDQHVIEYETNSAQKVSDYIEHRLRSGVLSFFLSYTIGLPEKIYSLFNKATNETSKIETPIQSPLKLTSKQNLGVAILKKRLKAKPGQSKTTLIISAEMQNPYVAAQLVDSVVNTLTRYIIEYRTQKAKTDLSFVEERHAEAEERYLKAQRNLAGYRDKNKNVILASVQTSEQNLQSEYNLAFNVYSTLSQQLEQAKMKVQEKTPVFKVVEPAKVPRDKSKPRTFLILFASVFSGAFLSGSFLILKCVWQKWLERN